MSVTLLINCKTSSTAMRKDEDDFPDVLTPLSPVTSIHSNCEEILVGSLACNMRSRSYSQTRMKIAIGAVVVEYERAKVGF